MKRTILISVAVGLILITAAFCLIARTTDNASDSGPVVTKTPDIMEVDAPSPSPSPTLYITCERYFACVRMMTFDYAAEADYAAAQLRGKDEVKVISVMNKYGSGRGGGIHVVEPGELEESLDAWCFDRSRAPGDVAVIETEDGFTVCYFSAVLEI